MITRKNLALFCLYNMAMPLVTMEYCQRRLPRLNTIRCINLSTLDTTEKCAKFSNVENETIIVKCDFCSYTEIGKFWIARFRAVNHRTMQHLICECNKRHNTSYDACHCKNCH